MRRKCGSIFFLFACGVFFAVSLHAQVSPDSSGSGVVTVRKAHAPAALLISFEYAYSIPDSSLVRWWENDVHPVSPPVPDTIRRDSAGTHASRQSYQYPTRRKEFDTRRYFASMNYRFAPDDSIRYDSAMVEFFIDHTGKATMNAKPWAKASVTTREFEKLVYAYCAKLTFWRPAVEWRNAGNLALVLDTKITFKVYAFDLNSYRQEIFLQESVR